MAKGIGDRTFLHDIILDIINDASLERPMQKKEIIQRLKQRDIELSRTTLDKKLSDLENKGYKMINVGRKGFYLEKTDDSLSDGELRFLIDVVMYSRLIPEDDTADMIEKLAKLGSGSFEKEMKKRAYSAERIEKDTFWGTIENVTIIQKALFAHKQISCNYITAIDFDMVYRFKDDIIVNPYELAFSGGKYYLLCSYENDEELVVLRLDKLDHLKILKSKCVENLALEKVKNEKGVQNYLYNQPELKGGQQMDFDLLCYKNSIDEVYDIFGKQNTRTKPIKPENYDDPESTMITVRTTREAMKSWAIIHADSIVVVNPDDFREEIVEAFNNAEYTYHKTGKPSRIRSFIARSLDDSIREAKISEMKKVRYMGHGKNRELETIDIAKYDIGSLKHLSLSHCKVCCSDIEVVFSNLNSISLMSCIFDTSIFKHFPALNSITIGRSTIIDLEFLKKYKAMKELTIIDCANVTNLSPILKLDSLNRFETNCECLDEKTTEKLHRRFPECRISVFENSSRGDNRNIATRSAFFIENGKVTSRNVCFEWFPGLSDLQKQRSIASLHKMIAELYNTSVPLEISTKGTDPLGAKLSTFNLRLDRRTFENVFQSSKILKKGGPFRDLIDMDPKKAKRDKRIRESGEIIVFNYDGIEFPTEPKTLFYDYTYIKAVKQNLTADEIKKITKYTHFTDIEFYPQRSINTQAKSVAIIKLMLETFGELPELSIDEFIEFHKENVLV